MEPITVDGMDEHEFRHEIEDMLRHGKVDEAVERLRALLEPYAGESGILPPRFLDVTSADVEFSGWQKLAHRLRNPDRPSHPISAIGIVLADARTLGGPGPTGGRLPPFIKTFYFGDDAFPFTDATRDDLLDGYTREGFGWQGDYQSTDAALSIKGIDDLYGAIVELEDRLFDNPNPSLEEIRAGSVGACYLAALIHQALRETIRKRGLPRQLCVLAACDGVYPFFDAPVAGYDECTVEPQAEPAPEEVWPNELENAAPADEDEFAEELPGEASLLSIVSRKGTKKPVLVLGEEAALEATRFTEMASAQRMTVQDELTLKGLFEGVPAAELTETDWFDEWDEPEESPASDNSGEVQAKAAPGEPGDSFDIYQTDAEIAEFLGIQVDAEHLEETPADVPFVAPSRHSLRSRINLAQPEAADRKPGLVEVIAAWIRRALLRR